MQTNPLRNEGVGCCKALIYRDIAASVKMRSLGRVPVSYEYKNRLILILGVFSKGFSWNSTLVSWL